MPRPKQPGLTENELGVMQVLWEKAPLKISEILERLKKDPKPAYTSVLTLVQSMERKGYVRHVKDGKPYDYFPKLERRKFMSSEIKRMAKRLFGGNPFSLAVNLVEDEHLSSRDIAELRRLLEEK